MNTQSKRINRIGKIAWGKHMAAWKSTGLTQPRTAVGMILIPGILLSGGLPFCRLVQSFDYR